MAITFNSTHVQSAEYDEDSQELTITFRYDGARYTYLDVPVYVYNGFAATIDPGDFFRSVIKGKFQSVGPF